MAEGIILRVMNYYSIYISNCHVLNKGINYLEHADRVAKYSSNIDYNIMNTERFDNM